MGILDRIRMLLETRKHKRYDAGKELDKGGYWLRKCVERGRFATVYLAGAKISGQRVAVKVTEDFNCMCGEKLVWRRLNHPNCVKLHHQFTSKGYTHFVCEYAEYGDVMRWLEMSGQTLGPHLEMLSKSFTRNVLTALEYCHNNQMAHLDFRWTNVVLDDNLNAKLTGFAYLCSKTDAEGICLGDPLYHPPEALTTGVNRELMDKVDMWQLGAALIHLLMGWYIPVLDIKQGLTSTVSDVAVVMDVGSQHVQLPQKTRTCGVSVELQTFVKELMMYKPEDRLSASQALNSVWLMT
ncbi:Checkpoint kinase 2 [Chamberlinius hualienensis]